MIKFELATGEKVLCTTCDKFTRGDTGKKRSSTSQVVWLQIMESIVSYVYCDACHEKRGRP